MPVRRIPKNRRAMTGRLPSSKSGAAVAYESALERDLFFVLEWDRNVVHYEEQPVIIEYRDETGRDRTYIPDALATYCDGSSVLFEVKYWEELQNRAKSLALRRIFQAGRLYARQRGWTFRVATERQIRAAPLDNIRFLLRYRDLPEKADSEARIEEALRSTGPMSVQAVLDTLSSNKWEQGGLLPSVWRMVATDLLQVDLSTPLTMQTQLQIE